MLHAFCASARLNFSHVFKNVRLLFNPLMMPVISIRAQMRVPPVACKNAFAIQKKKKKPWRQTC